jgi:hypothetical protein
MKHPTKKEPARKPNRTSTGSKAAAAKAKAKSKEAAAKAKAKSKEAAAKAKLVAVQLQKSKQEISVLKEQFRKHRHRNPDAKLTKEFQQMQGSKGNIKSDLMEELLAKFAEVQAAKGNERRTKTLKEYEQNVEATTYKRLDFRQVCIDNNLDVFGGEEVSAKIEVLIAIGYYTKKGARGRS